MVSIVNLLLIIFLHSDQEWQYQHQYYHRFLEEKGASSEEKEILVFASRTLVSLLNPIAPHLSEELWQLLGEKDLLSTESWPVYQKEKMYEELLTEGHDGIYVKPNHDDDDSDYYA